MDDQPAVAVTKLIATVYAAEVLYYQQEVIVLLPTGVSKDRLLEIIEKVVHEGAIEWKSGESDGIVVTDVQLENAKPTDEECRGLPVVKITDGK